MYFLWDVVSYVAVVDAVPCTLGESSSLLCALPCSPNGTIFASVAAVSSYVCTCISYGALSLENERWKNGKNLYGNV